MAAAAPFAATGGTDDCIHLFDVRVRVFPPFFFVMDWENCVGPRPARTRAHIHTHTNKTRKKTKTQQAHADLGFLMSPGNGAVSALAFSTPPGAGAPSHLLSGTADGGIAVWTAGGEWDCLKTMGDHT